MKKYILKRVLISVLTLLAITLVLFILLKAMPGSPFNDEKLTDDQRAVLFEKYGLDQPILVQYGKYVTNLVKGDFGVSYTWACGLPATATTTACGAMKSMMLSSPIAPPALM